MLGFVPNLHRLMSISPNVLSGWATLMGSLAKTLDVKTRDGIALAVSEADGCDYCLAAHSFIACQIASNSDPPFACKDDPASVRVASPVTEPRPAARSPT